MNLVKEFSCGNLMNLEIDISNVFSLFFASHDFASCLFSRP